MSIDRSSTGSTPPRRRHGLKMETLPVDMKSANTVEAREEDYHFKSTSSFETDEDFKFKRHRNKRNTGVPSLGERLDNLQDVKKARWVDNFNSSIPQALPRPESMRSPESSQIRTSQASPYMPYMYYYPMPPMAPMAPMPMPFQSPPPPMHDVPNSSLQPFYPPAQQGQDTPQLLPPPHLYSYNFLHQNQEESQNHEQRTRERRKSLQARRGRRLSVLASKDEEPVVRSPHRDVPEEDFYRHIGDTSFGKGLQIRQLFNWCIIRALRKKETQQEEEKDRSPSPDGLDPDKITLTIIKEFVNDLRRGKINIDWEAEEIDEYENDGEDTELRDLFAEDERPHKLTKNRHADRPRMPNVKNVENEKNLADLQAKIEAIRKEIKEWAELLDAQNPGSEWDDLRRLSLENYKIPISQELKKDNDNYGASFQQELDERVNKLQLNTHLLESSENALSQLSQRKIDLLSGDFVSATNAAKVDAKTLLRGLSGSLAD
ncbi:DSN1 (YIR010W) [Zygosaccharomyces parabailii]|uniref:BN860_02850g1_1 n=1 Tax=Zygosaccharomyces bailii (strain CLIB 213 / ATCC 58445 / CBS 680 / BCRC 21525 / NBRC 1098 / NCYC 1416 / NRRL Y-2227) TaxID=1333698 RepID=A0A8J2T475_ZYGB2|nr:DSN1 (YIR010W) [Zygosaccharomyces parabailii]CDF88123.1 BN860_02850g1_1 [Zygosaccharomyces bailii CLIB 213]